jgi:uncharacterized protein YjbI with pentapeptide repeats
LSKPPGGSSLLFGAIAEDFVLKQRKNGSYRMVLKGVDEIDWFTDRPNRVEGTWKPQKLLRKWDKDFATSEPNAQATVEVGDQRELFAFEMFKPKIKSGKLMFNIKPLSDSSEDTVTGLAGEGMDKVSLFIDDANTLLPCFPNCMNTNLRGNDLSGQDLYATFVGADMSSANLESTNFFGTLMNRAILNGANLQSTAFVSASLWKADLTGADLTNATIMDSDLIDAVMSNADLTNAILTGTNMAGTVLNNATWNNTTCPDGTMNDGTSPCTAEQINLCLD